MYKVYASFGVLEIATSEPEISQVNKVIKKKALQLNTRTQVETANRVGSLCFIDAQRKA